jgi:hypothetical protein
LLAQVAEAHMLTIDDEGEKPKQHEIEKWASHGKLIISNL